MRISVTILGIYSKSYQYLGNYILPPYENPFTIHFRLVYADSE